MSTIVYYLEKSILLKDSYFNKCFINQRRQNSVDGTSHKPYTNKSRYYLLHVISIKANGISFKYRLDN